MSAPKPLAGLRVLELARILAGPWCGQLLADLGADVVKVERATVGDDTRQWGPPFVEGVNGNHLGAAYFHACNRGKRCIEADFETPEGRKVVERLALHADVIIENFKVGGLKKYGLDYESLKKINPRLVYCSITGFGQTGPYAPRAGYDFLVQGMGGAMMTPVARLIARGVPGLVAATFLCTATPVHAQAPPDGRTVYLAHCAQCHEQVTPRVPHREALEKLPSARIVRALDAGAMLAIGMTMHRDERLAVASYLGTNAAETGPPATAFCAHRAVRVHDAPKGAWNGWSPTADNARFVAKGAGLTAEQVPNLKLKWAFGFAGDVTAFAAPTVIDDQVFVGSAGGVVHAMRASTGCLQWVFQANGPVRAAIVVAPLEGGRHALLFGDLTGWFYALSAETGELLWKQHVETHDSTRLTAAAAVHEAHARQAVRGGLVKVLLHDRCDIARMEAVEVELLTNRDDDGLAVTRRVRRVVVLHAVRCSG